jgi:hypothetical protein
VSYILHVKEKKISIYLLKNSFVRVELIARVQNGDKDNAMYVKELRYKNYKEESMFSTPF